MTNFKFHLVTVIGIFLALAVGIFIGSTFTEESIILQQRGTIEGMRADIYALQNERKELWAQLSKGQETAVLLQDWLGDLAESYILANPVEKRALLVYSREFSPDCLGSYLTTNVHTQIMLEARDQQAVQTLATAIIKGDGGFLTWNGEGVTVFGELREPPEYVLLALGSGEYLEVTRALTASLLAAEIPVVALGKSGWVGLADLVSHPLYASISHLDTPLGLYCLDAIFHGQGGHYGMENLLPPRGLGK
jgi:hypothetical protein